MRWIPLILPIAIAIAIVHDLDDLAYGGLARNVVISIALASVVLAALGVWLTRGTTRPGTYISCWIIGALALWRVTTEIAWTGAHSTLDAEAWRQIWFPLAIGLLCAAGGIAVGRPARQRR
jgi:uncharacterized protein (DUF2062 family)